MISFVQHNQVTLLNSLSHEDFLPLEVSDVRAFCETHLKLCKSLGFNPSTQPMLQHISAVGVTLDHEGKYEFQDRQLILDTFLHLSNAGFVFDPDFEIDPLSFEVGRDFLVEDTPTDVMIAAFLNDHGTLRTMFSNTSEWFYPHLDRVRCGDAQIANTAVSPKAYESDAWSKRVSEAGVKIVVNNNECDLKSERFKSSTHGIILPQERYGRSEGDQSGQNAYTFQNAYLRQMFPTLNKESPLFGRIKQTAQCEGIELETEHRAKISAPYLGPA